MTASGEQQLELDIAVLATATCQVAGVGLDRLTCRAREARFRCEVIGPHGDDEHAIGPHTREHERRGNGWRCDFRSIIVPFGDPFGLV